ncbi:MULTISPECIES: hypothetical protein [Sphingobacterium]|uniref:Uncharacterized protein n=1 Tax=Sphingobacterium populi TaxID=1812824 RepID=A0ABW5UEE7_9SPHI|nr:hypothetical protein [Sphingobacterium sp. CFCC 11742]
MNRYKYHIHYIIKYLSILIYILTSHTLNAQIIDNDQVDPRIKWEQFQTPHHRVIFPKSYRRQASLLTNLLDSMRYYASEDLNSHPRKIPVVLHANHILQNGFVQLAPRKTEFFPLPSGVASNVEWLPNLAQHELRHVAQMDKLSGKLRAPFLEQFAFAMFGIHLPAWYFEGDAVATETQFSTGGRGRMPSWFMPLRANELSGRSYTFDKNILGSFRDITPTFYLTGYLMNVHLTNQYGYEIREKILDDMRGNLFRPFNFYKALRNNSASLNSQKLYKSSIDSFSTVWKEEAIGKKIMTALPTPSSRYPQNYMLPQYDDGKVFSLFQSPQKVSQIVSIYDGKSTHIAYTGQQLTPYFHINKNLIVWDEIRKNPRYGKNTFQVIHLLNWKTGARKTLHLPDFVYTPSLSADNKILAVVRVDPAGRSSLLRYDLATETLVSSFLIPDGIHIQQPQFHSNGQKIVCIAVSALGTSLIEFETTTGKYEQLLPWGQQTLERPIYAGDDIIYKAHYNAIDNLYRWDRDTQTIHALTDALYGAFNPSLLASDSLLLNEYTPDGYRITLRPIESLTQILPASTKQLLYDRRDTEQGQHTAVLTDTLASDSLSSLPYNSISGLFNFHSLSISSNNFESLDNFRPGVFWLANDLLNTSQIVLGYEYDTDIRKSIYSADFTYAKYYPKFSLRYENRGQIGQARENEQSFIQFDWREHLYAANVQIPLSIFRQHMIYSYGLNLGTSYLKRYDVNMRLSNFNEEIAFPMTYQIYFNRNMRRSTMDLQPMWGQNFSMTYRHLPFAGDALSGNILSVRTGFFFPGIISNHGLQVRIGFQHKTGTYLFNNDIPVVSGFGYFPSPRVDNTLLLSYRMPIAYPDWTVGPLAYIKRIQARLFSDYQNIQDSGIAPKTFGVGLSADVNFLRYVLPDVNIGLQGIYINDQRASQRVVPVFNISYTY